MLKRKRPGNRKGTPISDKQRAALFKRRQSGNPNGRPKGLKDKKNRPETRVEEEHAQLVSLRRTEFVKWVDHFRTQFNFPQLKHMVEHTDQYPEYTALQWEAAMLIVSAMHGNADAREWLHSNVMGSLPKDEFVIPKGQRLMRMMQELSMTGHSLQDITFRSEKFIFEESQSTHEVEYLQSILNETLTHVRDNARFSAEQEKEFTQKQLAIMLSVLEQQLKLEFENEIPRFVEFSRKYRIALEQALGIKIVERDEDLLEDRRE